MRGTVDRDTNDLDFFIGHADVEADTIATMVAAVERALGEAGIGARSQRTRSLASRSRRSTRSAGSISRSTCACARLTVASAAPILVRVLEP
jgi:hypothetical protein